MRQTLEEAVREIEYLRRENEKLAIKVETFEQCFLMIRASQPPSRGGECRPDVVWELNERLRELPKDG